MSNQQNLAYEYALGLLTQPQKDAIEQTDEFIQAVEKIQQQLLALHLQAPLEADSSKKIWRNISQQIKTEKKSWSAIFSTHFQPWVFASAVFLIFGSFMLMQQNSPVSNPYSMMITNAQAGWTVRADVKNHSLFIASAEPMLVGKNEVCALWVKKNGQTHFVSTLPNSGNKTLTINPNISKMFDGGEAIISIESSKKPFNQPTRIEYRAQIAKFS
jgi:anti-sigma-K factor RskA